ncbi:Sec-independent protein translocase subunit TatA [Nesterenkonia sp. MY13]|uniref:Sec-independent protein translocase protein TatA n=1 Tax=Nesterenkonia sedimenti TaxID=1463632 RepID=A0A7X8YCV2_9MICC|nr:Sec-independent protein translocase subunit TatA [Nesterenkonia sedimenti]NLS08711.1 Sec-independent protein translocase subunit TatA [Nesterenkonia sedimenti]
MNISGWQWLILLLIILLLFGATKLPRLARSLGESARIFKSEVKTMRDEDSEKPEEEEGEDTRAVEGKVIDPTADVHRGKNRKDQP